MLTTNITYVRLHFIRLDYKNNHAVIRLSFEYYYLITRILCSTLSSAI